MPIHTPPFRANCILKIPPKFVKSKMGLFLKNFFEGFAFFQLAAFLTLGDLSFFSSSSAFLISFV